MAPMPPAVGAADQRGQRSAQAAPASAEALARSRLYAKPGGGGFATRSALGGTKGAGTALRPRATPKGPPGAATQRAGASPSLRGTAALALAPPLPPLSGQVQPAPGALEQRQEQQHGGDADGGGASHEHTHRPTTTTAASEASPAGSSYISLMQTMRQHPSSSEFVYLRRVGSGNGGAGGKLPAYNPYALEVVPFAAVDESDFCTMSARGVTHYLGGRSTDFTTLEQWEREYQLFNAVSTLGVFRKYRAWKSFSVWRRGVRLSKMRRAQKALKRNLFHLDSAFQAPLQEIRGLCHGMQSIRLHRLRGGVLYTLDKFVQEQREQREHVSERLVEFSRACFGHARQACADALQRQEDYLNDFYSKDDEDKLDATHRRAPRQVGDINVAAAAKAAFEASAEAYAYTIAAARRSEQRRLMNFIRMADYMICNTLIEILIESISDILIVMADHGGDDGNATPRTKVVRQQLRSSIMQSEGSPEGNLRASVTAPGLGGTSGGGAATAGDDAKEEHPAIFEVEILFEDRELVFHPSTDEFQSRVDEVLGGFVDTIGSMGLLAANEELIKMVAQEGEQGDVSVVTDLIEDETHQNLALRVKESLALAFDIAEEYKSVFIPYQTMVLENETLDIAGMKAGYQRNEVTQDQFREDVARFSDQRAMIEAIDTDASVGIIKVSSAKLRATFLPSPIKCLEELHVMLPSLASELYQNFIAVVHDATARLSRQLSSAEDFVDQLGFLTEVQEGWKDTDDKMLEIKNLIELIQGASIPIPELDHAAYQTLTPDFNTLKGAIDDAEAAKEDNIARFSGDLAHGVEQVSREVSDIRNRAQHEMILDEHADVGEVIKYTTELSTLVKAQEAAAKRIAGFERLFKVPESQFEDLVECAEEVELKRSLWVGLREWSEVTEGWRAQKFFELNDSELDEKVQRFTKLSFKVERGLPSNRVVPKLKDAVEDFKHLVPCIKSLRNTALKDRHWKKIEEAMGTALTRDENFTLGVLLDLKIMEHMDAIGAISTEATQEQALEELMLKVQRKWADIEFVVSPYKDTKDVYILGSLDDIMVALEDSMVTMTTILASRFVSGIRAEVDKLNRQLRLFSDTLDEWTAVQKTWMYLESIFSAPDIQRQLPNESKAFFSVDKSYRDIMRRVRDRPSALQAGTTPGWREQFQKSNDTLERVQKQLEDYLETKRMAFPRFYFLSNDELLEILAQTKNVQAVQPHISKCFDGIASLDFGDDPKSIDIFAMRSAQGERVSLGKNLKARGNVESWLGHVEAAMQSSLKKLTKQSYQDYAAQERAHWVLNQAAQIVLMVSQIYWCCEVEQCFGENAAKALAAFAKTNVDRLNELTALVRGQLSKLERKIIVALITIDVHARDIVLNLVKEKVDAATDFNWQMQLRYAWSESEEISLVRQVNAEFNYAYEYLGAQSRLVVTPMTDRCYMTLTGALHLKLGGAPAGPAGTGKTETTKDLGKALGVNCVVFNCGDTLDVTFMGKFFAGLSQCGAWACFDEFNRIDIEVLSVVAQQLLTIQNALQAGVSKFMFEGREIRLVPTFGAFITMNPGYAGRTELPDNLKALFRPMAMMIPDYALVAEVMLFAEGFESAKKLSSKMVKLYKLSSEQLSQQAHYDFGMRALKSVLVMAGSLKRASPDLSEDIVLIRAMRDSNIPKFLKEDALLFNAIVGDLFPGVEVPAQDYGSLEVAIRDRLRENALQEREPQIAKIVELFMTFNVRFGVMVVGPTGGGKSTVHRILAEAMTSLREKGDPDERYQVVHTSPLNPKCISMGELYGEYNELTGEWSDGLASTIIRNAVTNTANDRFWTLFDGPVDAIWIENMNTVLDDNCTLCLSSGERIKLNPTTQRMLFEVNDLAVASPATVSRCGMVYLDADDLGWEPFVRTWVDSKLCGGLLTQDTKDFVYNELFVKFLTPALRFVRRNCGEGIPSVDINLAASCTSLVTALVNRSIDTKRPEEELHPTLAAIFSYALCWSAGGNIAESDREAFSDFLRDLMSDSPAPFPPSGEVYDHVVDVRVDASEGGLMTAEFRPWSELVEPFKFDMDAPFFSMLVPTVDTTRFSYLLEVLIEADRSVLYTGVTGVGKSVVATDALRRLEEPKGLVPIFINFSAQTAALDTQLLIESKLEKKRKTRLGAPIGKKIVILVDDVNMPAREVWGAAPPIELLRQFHDYRGFYDRQKLFFKDIEDVVLCAACGPPGGGRQEMTPRFTRHFTMLALPQPDDENMRTIFGSILGGFLKEGFATDQQMMCAGIVSASVEMYRRICAELLPTPSKSHYTFNLRDTAKVVQGMLMVRSNSVTTKQALARLWVHEASRVFSDRMTNNEDKEYFNGMVTELVGRHLGGVLTHDELFGEGVHNFFGDYMKMGAEGNDRVYEEITDVQKMLKVFDDYLDEHNLSSKSPMNLVFFMDAVGHITRAARVLRQPRGNAMMVGVGGSGKQSLTRFACFMANYEFFQIELTRGYGTGEFREDLKNLFTTAGMERKQVCFCFTDTQVINEGFLEDLNNLLNSGEVPGMYEADEKERIIGDIRPYVESLGLPPTRDVCWSTFVNGVRDNLHVVLCMSPVGEAFRARCRQFPSLINCCTIDWYSSWPREALLSVSRRFLEKMDLGSDEAHEAVISFCPEIHLSVKEMAERFFAELRRRYYTTPKSYLDLIALYTKLLGEKRAEFETARDRLLNGLSKLSETNAMVDGMQEELTKLQPVLEEKSKATAELLVNVERDQAEAEKVKAVVAVEEKQVKEQADATKLIADDAKADLAEALPALEAAVESLNSLNKADITEMRSFPKPPPLVQKTMEAVCVLLQEKPDWDTAKRVMNDTGFLKRLYDFDKDNMPDKVLKQLKKHVESEDFMPDIVARQSNAAKSLCMWCRAMDVYARVAAVVEPKRKALAAAEAELAEANATLAAKQAELQRVVDNVESLQRQLKEAQDEQASLAEQADTTSKRLARAGKLTSGLADEQVRWKETAEKIAEDTRLLVGDVFIAAACVSYYGAFSGAYREELVGSWVARCKDLGIPVSEVSSLRNTLANPVELREWAIWGLPSDDVSVDNGILVTRGKRWPLMIDPQAQANKWIKAMEAKNGLRVIKLTDSTYLRTLENSVRIGCPVLIEDVGETLDPALEPILQKNVFKQGNRSLIRIGDSDVDYDPNFKLYLTSKLSNPSYLPEVCIKITLINFFVTERGLEDQLLGDVVRKERPDLEEQKDRLVVSISNDKKQLKELEDKILKLLKESEGNILDDEVLINTLNNSKLTSSVISKRVEEAEVTEKAINEAREGYRVVANRGSILYFVVANLGLIGHMYQYSLSYFVRMFNHCIDAAEKSEELEERLRNLNDYITLFMYQNVCRGLFEEHKLMFSFLMCTSIERAAGAIDVAEWNFVLRGTAGLSVTPSRGAPEGCEAWLGDDRWQQLAFLQDNVPNFDGLLDAVATDPAAFEAFARHETPESAPLPEPLAASGLNRFSQLLLCRVLREERMMSGFSEYVGETMGEDFVATPPWKLPEVFPDTSNQIPVVFVLSTGADPTAMLQRFAASKGWAPGERLHMISLGQGQGPVAESLISSASKSGDWVVLQNCHLAKSWMLSLEQIVEGLATGAGEVHEDFRLWLTSMPAPHFPVPVLQSSIKLVQEPPRGVKANLLRSYSDYTDEQVDSCAKPDALRKMLVSLSFFHAIIQERRKFGPLGWNIRYEFNQSDIECAGQTLRMFLDEQEQIPWPALLYVTGDINYGGRVTDDLDRRCIRCILRQYYTEALVETDTYKFSKSGVYYAPACSDVGGVMEYVRGLPASDDPEVFGMHDNANVTFQLQETRKIIDTVLGIQPRMTGGGSGKTPEETVSELCAEMSAAMPSRLDPEQCAEGMFARNDEGQMSSLAVVLLQEMERFNKLLDAITGSLSDLQKAIKGLVVMSGELEAMFTAMLNNQVPELWARASYPSLKPLSSYVRDFHERMAFMHLWLHDGMPKCYPLPSFFFPQGFMTGMLQTHARKYAIPIDTLNIAYEVLGAEGPEEVEEGPQDGVYVSGLFVDSARWDRVEGCLAESLPAVMHDTLPVVHFRPEANYEVPSELYECPLYKTTVRAGVLNTTGQSTNFVCCVALPVQKGTNTNFWVLQGSALMCALSS